MSTAATVRKRLFDLQDVSYKEFQCKLIPGISTDKVIGVRTPALRALAKELVKNEHIQDFLDILPHDYYDEYNLHGFILSLQKDYNRVIHLLDRFLPYVDNWATCDLLSPAVFKKQKNHAALLLDIQRWMSSDEPFIIRFGIEMLMSHFLDEDFKEEYLAWVAAIDHPHYYVRMMVAWYFATALAKQYTSTLPYIERKQLQDWTHNKTIQKAIESFRITPEQKCYLRTLKV